MKNHLADVEEWLANDDARGYAIVGDPAVRLNGFSRGAEDRLEPSQARFSMSKFVPALDKSGKEYTIYNVASRDDADS